MRAIRLSFFHMLKFIRQDRMLLAAGTAPLLAGTAIKYAVPLAESGLIRITGAETVLSAYYSLFDIFFASLVPTMFCFISAMVMLEERDDHIDRYLFTTGLGKRGYYISRILLPALAAFAVTAVLLPLFHLTPLSFGMNIFLSLAGTLQGINIALMILVISSNKLEGMAVTKLSALIIFGAVVPYFVPAPFCFGFSFLPSFWMGKAVCETNIIYMLLSISAGGFWATILWKTAHSSKGKIFYTE